MPSGRVSRSAFCLALLFALTPVNPLLAGPPATAKDPLLPRVRAVTPKAKKLIETGLARSATFRSLVEILDKSDVVVLLETTPELPADLDGRLLFLTKAAGIRYLHAQITPGLNMEELIAVAAHELQHAIEVATHPEVRCADTLRGLYQRIGIQSHVKDRYDTTAAQATGRQVSAELG
jgi:hypothetical protein